jgi:uncharacterized protein (TIGR03435 family)
MRTAVFACLIALSSAFAQTDALPTFEVASVKPNHSGSGSSSSDSRPGNLQMTNMSLRNIVTMAYDLKDYQIEAPDWLKSESFDIVAKGAVGTTDKQLMLMLRNLLVERFKLETHHETKEFSVLALVPTKGGFLLKPVAVANDKGAGTSSNSNEKGGELKATQITLAHLAEWVAGRMKRPVVDMTGIPGAFDLNLKYSIENDQVDTDPARYPVLPLALQEQLGLRLEKRTAPIDLLVVDRAEKIPVEN